MKTFIDILFNLGTMTTFGVISSLVGNNNQKPIRRQIFHGIIFGSGAVIGMLNPVVLRPGLIFDGRSVLISLAALIYGPLTGIISALMALTLRIIQGGAGVWMGSSVIVMSASVGIFYYYRRKKQHYHYSVLDLFAFGLLIHFLMIICILALPRNLILSTFKTITLPVMIIYPLATVVLGKILTIILSRSHILESLQKSEEKYLLINNASQDFIYSYDLKSRFTYANRSLCEEMHLPLEKIVGLSHAELGFPEDKCQDWDRLHQEVLSKNASIHAFSDTLMPDGLVRNFEVTLNPLHNNQGQIIGISGLTRDISDRKRAEKEIKELNEQLEERVKQRTQELEESNKALQSFSYCVSHDLRAPLRAIEGFSKIVLDDYSDKLDSTGTRFLTIISQSVGRMNLLINGLLLISRVTNAEFKKSKINMKEMVDRILNELKESNQIPLQVKIIYDELMPIDGDPALIRQVFVNLLENAIKFSSAKSNPLIKISSYPEGENVVFVVKDNGVGFNQNYAKQLFTVFQRLHSPEEFPGIGIGLALIERVIQRHSGKVWAEGIEGQGATFYFSLPLSG